MAESFWTKFERWANSLRIDSVSIGGVRLGFRSDAFASAAYDQILQKLSSREAASEDVFITSAHNVDEIYRVDLIKPDHECDSSVCAAAAGGSGANTAYALGQMGWATGIAGVIGNDDYGRILHNSLFDAGVDITLLQKTDHFETGRTATVVEDSGKRMIVVMPGANNLFHSIIKFDDLFQRASASKIFHSSSFVSHESRSLQEEVLAAVSGHVVTSLTPGALYAREGLDRLEGLIRHLNIIYLYRDQLEQLITKSSARSFAKANDTQSLLSAYFLWKEKRGLNTPQVLVVKDPLEVVNGMLGQGFLSAGAGCVTLETFVPPRSFNRQVVYRAEDTTGAGDWSAAGFTHALLRSSSLGHAVDTAFLMAALVSTQMGPRGSLAGNPTEASDRADRVLPRSSGSDVSQP